MKIKKSLVATLIFLALLALTYLIHINYFRVDVVLYGAILDGALAVFLASVILYAVSYFAVLNHFEKAQLIVIWLLLSYTYAISAPTVLDRSLSFYILEKIQQRGGGIKLSGFEKVFTDEYINEHRLVDVRLTEQQSSGTVIIVDGCVKLTQRGDYLASFSRYFRQHLLPKKRLLMGEYTDVLTDPFRYSKSVPDYLCE